MCAHVPADRELAVGDKQAAPMGSISLGRQPLRLASRASALCPGVCQRALVLVAHQAQPQDDACDRLAMTKPAL